MLQTGESCNGNSRRRSISKPFYPRLWVLMHDRARSRPRDDRMTRGNELSKPLVWKKFPLPVPCRGR